MMRIDPRAVGAVALLVSLAACVAPPMAPTIPVAPGPGKTFDAFAADQQVCAQYAYNQTAAGAGAANNQAVGTAIIGTALGAGLGAAIGGGRGAAIGAASGAALGTVAGASGSGLCADVAAAAIRRPVRRVHGSPRQPGARLRAAAGCADLPWLQPAPYGAPLRLWPAGYGRRLWPAWLCPAGLRIAAALWPAVLTIKSGNRPAEPRRAQRRAVLRLSVR